MLVPDCGRIDRQEGAPKVGALGDIERVSRNRADFGCPGLDRRRESLPFRPGFLFQFRCRESTAVNFGAERLEVGIVLIGIAVSELCDGMVEPGTRAKVS